MDPLELVHKLARVMVDMKAENVVILDLEGISDILDAFVVGTASGGSHHARALSEAVWEEYKKHSKYKGHVEGTDASGWILLDCGDFVVHVMSPRLREYYALEELWGDAPRIEVGPDEEAEKWSKRE